jgi:uncharacterized membrane protein
MFFFRRKPLKQGLSTARMEAFSDSIFGFAITLLVLNITVPELSRSQALHGELLPHLLADWPRFLTYAMSFAIIGIFWVGHTIMFHYIKRSDRKLLWLNALLLMSVGFMPFPTNILGKYAPEMTAVLLYGITLMIAGLLFTIIWLHASTNKHLVDKNLPDEVIKKGLLVVSVAPIVYVIAITLAFVNPLISLGIYITVPILYILPSPIDDLIE